MSHHWGTYTIMRSTLANALRDRLQAALGDTYTLDSEMSSGGMCCVYRATDPALARAVVVKALAPEFAADGAAARFRREILAAARFCHPNIVPVLAAGEAGGFLHYTMPFIDGESLRGLLDRSPSLPVTDVVRILRDVATALAHAHAHGVVHRDVKPENVVIEASTGRSLVADFGIARLLDAEAHLTQDGAAVGTPLYMSPEQIDGKTIDGRSDVYSLGLVAWEMLTGRRPWAGETLCAVLYNQKYELLPSVAALRPEVPRALCGIIDAALAKDPMRRPTAEALLAALNQADRAPPRPSRVRSVGRILIACALLLTGTTAPRAANFPSRETAPSTLSVIPPIVLSSVALPSALAASTPRVSGPLTLSAPSAVAVVPLVRFAAHVRASRADPSAPRAVPLITSRPLPVRVITPPPLPVRVISSKPLPVRVVASPSIPPAPLRITHGDSLARCSSFTDTDQAACYAALVNDDDKGLDGLVARLINALSSRRPSNAENLREGQAMWRAMRERTCSARVPADATGQWAERRAACSADWARRRAASLQPILTHLSTSDG